MDEPPPRQEKRMIDPKVAALGSAILDHACPNGGCGEDDWNTYIIETHCVLWKITAKKQGGQWAIRETVCESA